MAPKGAKKKPRVKKIKLDLKDEMEKIKGWSVVLAEMTAVQSELVEGLDLDPDSNIEEQHVISQQLRAMNNQCEQLGSMIENYIHAMIGAFRG